MSTREKSRKVALENFDANGVGVSTLGIYGLPFTPENAEIIVLSAPWDVTVSAGTGMLHGPQRIAEQSLQVELHHQTYPDFWKAGIAMVEIPGIKKTSIALRKQAEVYIDFITKGGRVDTNPSMEAIKNTINAEGEKVNALIKKKALQFLNNGQMVCLVGGDHSTSLGLLQAQGEMHKKFGVLHIDAHADLRQAYEGFTFSHGSVMYNALPITQLKKIVQVGIRDYSKEEVDRIISEPKLLSFLWEATTHRMFENYSWKNVCDDIIRSLPPKVHISLDVDGLDPSYCPHTGTPVPGGLSYDQMIYLLQQLHKKRTIIGFDLVEVGDHQWDGNVGARLLYQMCMYAHTSHK
ncbi:MAG: agmatinase family protein [candidate division SR1 bacterium]|nr:agmatinase family protein [candidate division SR1 bacterium]